MGKLLLAAVCLSLLQFAPRAAEPAADSVTKKLTAAKEAYYADRDRADEALVKLLEKKAATAKQAGDLKSLEAVQAETEAFRKEGTLPKTVPLTAYEPAMKSARTKLETVYQTAMKAYVVANKLDEARALQKQLEQLLKAKGAAPQDPFQVGSEWTRPDHKIVVTERKEETFKAIYSGPKFDREVTGTIKDGKFEWLAKNTRIIRGSSDANHRGEIIEDQGSYKMKVSFGSGGGKFEMQLKQK